MTYEQLVRSWSETGQDRYGPDDVRTRSSWSAHGHWRTIPAESSRISGCSGLC